MSTPPLLAAVTDAWPSSAALGKHYVTCYMF